MLTYQLPMANVLFLIKTILMQLIQMTKEITINNKEKKFFFSQSFSEFYEFRLSLDISKKG